MLNENLWLYMVLLPNSLRILLVRSDNFAGLKVLLDILWLSAAYTLPCCLITIEKIIFQQICVCVCACARARAYMLLWLFCIFCDVPWNTCYMSTINSCIAEPVLFVWLEAISAGYHANFCLSCNFPSYSYC